MNNDSDVTSTPLTVVILGASEKDDRYANKAQRMLMDHGCRVFPVSPTGRSILDVIGYRSLGELGRLGEAIDTVTIYVKPVVLATVIDELIALHPRRVIFNPDTEDRLLQEKLQDAGIHVVLACTLVLLRTGQFEIA